MDFWRVFKDVLNYRCQYIWSIWKELKAFPEKKRILRGWGVKFLGVKVPSCLVISQWVSLRKFWPKFRKKYFLKMNFKITVFVKKCYLD